MKLRMHCTPRPRVDPLHDNEAAGYCRNRVLEHTSHSGCWAPRSVGGIANKTWCDSDGSVVGIWRARSIETRAREHVPVRVMRELQELVEDMIQ